LSINNFHDGSDTLRASFVFHFIHSFLSCVTFFRVTDKRYPIYQLCSDKNEISIYHSFQENRREGN